MWKKRILFLLIASILCLSVCLAEGNDSEVMIRQLEKLLEEQNEQILGLEVELAQLRSELDTKDSELTLSQEELEAVRLLLAQQQKLEVQQLALSAQAGRIDALTGIRKTMITDLSAALARSGIDAKVDESGSVVLNSSVLFETGKSAILPEGQALLNRFIPVYLDVLLQDKYADYLGEIIIEGHTDSAGTYEKNLKLSQDRALQVALYCLEMPSLTPQQKAKLQQIMTARGRSYSDPVYDAYGMEDKDASRRVEFKFRLKDAEMMEELIRILSSD